MCQFPGTVYFIYTVTVSYTHLDVYKRQEERSADAAQGSIVVGVRETEESEFADGHGDVQAANVSEVADGQGDVHAASVEEGDEVEVEEKFGGSVVELSLIHI